MLRQPARQTHANRQAAHVVALPAPWKGLNTRDRLEETDPGYATVLINFIPGNSEVNLRKGRVLQATGMPALPIESLMECAIGGAPRLFAAIGTEIYDVTAVGAVGSASVTGLSNARWQHTMYATTGGQFLVCVNGADGVRTFNGTTWAEQTINGVDAATLVGVAAHKARLWFVQAGTLKAWYLPPLAIAGSTSGLNLGPIAKRGGTIQALSGWSVDAGDGADDYLVFVTSEGECIVFAGTDPNSDATWSHIGTYQTDRPMGRRCLVKFGADLLILTSSGVVSVSGLLNTQSRWASISELLRDDFQTLALANRNSFGWEIAHYPKRGWLITNVPTADGRFDQYLYNSLLPPPSGWCQLKEQNASCWGFLDGDIYFGGIGIVYKADTDGNDAGEDIVGRAQWAWSRFETGLQKRFTLARPHMRCNVKPTPQLEMRTDYDISPPTSVPTLAASFEGGRWNVSDWNEAEWAAETDVYSQWISVSGIGHVGGLRLTLSSSGTDFALVGAEVAFEAGGVL